MKTVLSIQSQVAGARVGNSVAAFAMERLGVRVLQLPTVLLGRRPDHGPPGGGPIPAATLSAMIEGLAADGVLAEVDAVLSGYLGASDHVAVVLGAVAQVKAANAKAVFVCDPVLGDDGKLFVRDEIADAVLNGLWRHADWLTPNAFELGLLTGRTVDSLESAREAARYVGKPVLCSSIRTALGLGNLLAAPTGDWFCETPRLPRAQKGAGDLLSALYVARRVRGDALVMALEGATGSVYDVIVRSLAADSEDLLLPEAQDLLEEPVTWPRARSLERV
ncbi:pyridoxal kinase [Vitreimonas flagellata]|uniref:pyridoxal kinase n=1 Tax=Vitreimonas flagellata TaxID=2560861 RepID=UPI00107533D7|nr:pyridoxal kinase [Vitreimonas flagellata]